MSTTFTLQDSSGQFWQISVTTGGLLQTTSVSGSLPPPSGAQGTYFPQDAVNLVQKYVHGAPIDSTLGANACDIINSIIWHYYPWYWSISPLTAITCVDGTQDYSPTDTNILRPLKLQLVRTDVNPKEYRELALLANLSQELTRKGGLDTNTGIGWLPSSNLLRLMLAASVGSGQTLQIQGLYQAVEIKITISNIATSPLWMPDRYFDVFVEGLKWKIYQLTDDPRAGGVQVSKNGDNRKAYSGQYGIFREMLDYMARTEDLASGDEFSFPEQPLGVGRNYWPGLYGV